MVPRYDEWLEETGLATCSRLVSRQGSEEKFLKWLANTKEAIVTGDMREALREIDSAAW